MLELYLAFLIFGGGLLAYSLIFGGGDSDSTGTHSSIGSGDAHHFHLGESSGDTVTSIEHGHSSVITHHNETTDAVKFLSFRSLIYFSAFFGLTGTILTITETGFLTTILSSGFIGFLSAYSGTRFFRYLSNSQSGEPINLRNLTGRIAHVSLDIHTNSRGKIIAEISGQKVEITASLAETSKREKLFHGDEVYILEIQDNKAIVIEKDS